jgi:hypothetical protein
VSYGASAHHNVAGPQKILEDSGFGEPFVH